MVLKIQLYFRSVAGNQISEVHESKTIVSQELQALSITLIVRMACFLLNAYKQKQNTNYKGKAALWLYKYQDLGLNNLKSASQRVQNLV